MFVPSSGMSTDFGKRLQTARRRANLTQKQLAAAAEMAQSTVAELEKIGFGSSKTLQIAQACGVSARWLATGEGPMELGMAGVVMQEHAVAQLATKESLDGSLEIPQYAAGGRMGAAGLVLRDQPGLIKSWRVTSEWVQKNVHNITSANNLAIVTGFGDSMRPLYNPGDPLLVDIGVTAVEFDAIYFFRVGEEGFIKRLQRIPSNGLLVISENRSYRDWTIDGTMDFQVFARVVKVWRGEDF